MINQLFAWDGKSADAIGKIYAEHCDEPTFVADLIALMDDPALESGATWLLKCHCDQGHTLPPDDVAQIYAVLPHLQGWEARLHLLQCMPHMPIPRAQKVSVEAFLRTCLADKNKMVRAWAYNGFYELSVQYPEYRDETDALFTAAMNEEAASVKARIRNILKKGWA